MTNSSDKKVQILYFASLREQRGLDQESVQTPATTVAELYEQLQDLHGFTFQISGLQVAVNDQFSQWDTVLKDNDTVAFLTPVAGG
jgi:molybdopterin converting factor subunit 1